MKKTLSFVFAAIAMLTVASCAKELLEPAELSGETVTLTLNLGDGTKTAYQNGKTVWKAGDKVLISDGKNKVEVAIPSEGAGLSGCAVTLPAESLSFDGNLYAVYPVSAFASAAGDVINVTIPNDQSGLFEEANICVAKSTDGVFMLKNATAVMKITVEDDVESVMISGSAADTLAGKLAVTYTDAETPVTVKASSPVKSVKIAAGGLGDTYYAAVVPGKYEEISVLALTLDGKSQRKTTTNKTLKVNDMANLGVIGDDLSGSSMEGSGAEDDPFLIKDLGDITTLATFVNNGLSYSGSYFKVVNDIEDISIPIGTYDQVAVPFEGNFDGDNHVLTLAMGGDDADDDYLALFGFVGGGANIHDLTVAGTVKTTGNYAAGVIARLDGKTVATASNLTNRADVTAGQYAGGVVGSTIGVADAAESRNVIDNCQNFGSITATNGVGGIAANALYTNITSCVNSGNVTSTATTNTGCVKNSTGVNTTVGGTYSIATGGVVGWLQNSSVKESSNGGTVTGFFKVGGVCGGTYWGPVTSCTNSGKVEATGNYNENAGSQNGFCFGSCVGGIVGWVYQQGHITTCTNTGDVVGLGGQGGIVGLVTAVYNSSSFPNVTGCTNEGKVSSHDVYWGGGDATHMHSNPGTGGIAGIIAAGYSSASKVVYPSVLKCVNKGVVESTGKIVGGIVGLVRSGNKSNGALGTVDGCVNEGDVTGLLLVGGVVGSNYSQYSGCYTVKNCANLATVTATVTSDFLASHTSVEGAQVGGILGGSVYTPYTGWIDTYNHLKVYNSYNWGDVIYSDATIASPRAGGVVGNVKMMVDVQNCYNAGAVGSTSDVAETAKATTGGIFGYLSKSYASFCYYLEDVAENAFGTASVTPSATICSYDIDGLLSTNVTANKIDCDKLLQVLNEWQNYYVSYKYNNWKEGDNGPVLDETQD